MVIATDKSWSLFGLTAKNRLTGLLDSKPERIAVNEMRKHIGWYIKGLNGAAAFRAKINLTDKPEDALALIRSFFEDQVRVGKEGENGDEKKE